MSETKSSPSISVIVPVYNVLPYLERCIASLDAQTLDSVEFIMIDDGSTDGSAELLNRCTAGRPRFKVFRQENGGVGPARNFGMQKASGEYLLFVDSDDWVEPDFCRYALELAKLHDAEVVQLGFEQNFSNGARRIGHVSPDQRIVTGRFAMVDFPGMAWAKLFRRDLLERAGMRFPAGYYEDLAEIPRVLSYAHRTVRVPRVLYHYWRHEASITAGGFHVTPKDADAVKKITVLVELARTTPERSLEYEYLALKKGNDFRKRFEKVNEIWCREAIAVLNDIEQHAMVPLSENPYTELFLLRRENHRMRSSVIWKIGNPVANIYRSIRKRRTLSR